MVELSLQLRNSDPTPCPFHHTLLLCCLRTMVCTVLLTSAPLAGSILIWTSCNLAPFQALWQPSLFSFSICSASPGFPSEALILLWQPNALYFIFSPGHSHRWRKAERLFTFLTGAAFNSATAAIRFRSEMDPKTDGSAVTILSPRGMRTDPK